MSAVSDDLDAKIDAWTQGHLAALPNLSTEKGVSGMAILESGDSK